MSSEIFIGDAGNTMSSGSDASDDNLERRVKKLKKRREHMRCYNTDTEEEKESPPPSPEEHAFDDSLCQNQMGDKDVVAEYEKMLYGYESEDENGAFKINFALH